MPAVVVGRDAELASIRDFVTGISDGASALVLEGEAGMGKTTLWRAGVEAAETAGLRVLQAAPAESETALSFSGLGDLLDPVLDQALAPLAPGQRSALGRALVLEEVVGPHPDAHAAGVALLNALRGLASDRHVVLAVDDVQWLDAASAGALAYATRRLRAEHVGILLARRAGLESSLLDELRRSGRAERFTDFDVGPLDVAALHQVVQAHLGVTLPRPLLAEVHQASGGNPFYALEIVRTLTRSGVSVEAGRPLPVPDSLHDLVHGRLLALPPESRDFLIAAAAHAHPTISVTETATGVGRGVGLTPALEARIVETEGDRIRFTHPLLIAGALETADPQRRAQIHARLAELLEDPEARAWQLAASVDRPEETVASALEEAAHHARSRGALRPAALLLDRACELTPADREDARVQRGVDAAYLHFESGDARRAEAQLRELLGSMAPGPDRAPALWVLARIRTYEAPQDAADLFLEVVRDAGQSKRLLAAAHEGVASSLFHALERLAESADHASAALALADELGDDALAGDILITRLLVEALLGEATASGTAEHALELQHAAADRRVLDQPLIAVAEYWLWTDEPSRAKAAFIELLLHADEIGDESARPYLLYLLGQAECLLGSPESARERGREGHAAAEQSGQRLFAAYNLALQCLAEAQLGGEDKARGAARRALELTAGRVQGVNLVLSSALAHLEHAVGARQRVVVERLEPTLEFVRREAVAEPGATRFVVDQVEALIELGRRDEALELLDWYEGNARRLERTSALANCARCRGLLASQAGDLDGALAASEEALELHARVELPLDRGRTLFVLGAAQRRLKRRKEARSTLEEALAVFERIGAALWADRARAELTRISGRAATPGALTPAEKRVAALVAEGKTNREVAAALFLSDRTVEGHLSRVFGKLGIRHRTELGPALASRQTQGIDAPNTGDSPVSTETIAP
jgi:DNA-binding NarL/FixJ family response regulator